MQGPSIQAAEKKALPEQKLLPEYLKVILIISYFYLEGLFTFKRK